MVTRACTRDIAPTVVTSAAYFMWGSGVFVGPDDSEYILVIVTYSAHLAILTLQRAWMEPLSSALLPSVKPAG